MSLRSNSVTEERVLSRSKCSIDTCNICCGTGTSTTVCTTVNYCWLLMLLMQHSLFIVENLLLVVGCWKLPSKSW